MSFNQFGVASYDVTKDISVKMGVNMMKITIFVFVFGANCVNQADCRTYAFNCTGTFHPMALDVVMESPDSDVPLFCVWRLEAAAGDRFRLRFVHKKSSRDNCGLEIDHLMVRDGHEVLSFTACEYVETKNNVLRVQYIHTRSEAFHFETVGFNASVEILSSRHVYTLHTSNKLSWREALDSCEADGGTLASSSPVRTVVVNNILKQHGPDLWLGESVSPWAMLRGCVVWQNLGEKPPAYSKSKYNQFVECSWACLGHKYFLLQNTSCYCLNEIVLEESTSYHSCDIPCPGDSTEPCGGKETFTKYQYYDVDDGQAEGNCISTDISLHMKPTDCQTRLGFTCQFMDGSSDLDLSWAEARDYCGIFNSSTGLKPVPDFKYDDEQLWTSVIRKIDWNFPTVAKRMPTYSFTDSQQHSTEQHGFICQHENIMCGDNVTGEAGLVTSPVSPGGYSINQYCVWWIQVAEGMVVQLDWHEMHVEDSDFCIYDYLEIQDYGSKVRHRYCGTEKPASIISKTSTVTVTFRSDSTVSSGGFNLTWQQVEPLIDAEESSGRKSGLSGGVVVILTTSLTVVVVGVIIIIVVVVRKGPRTIVYSLRNKSQNKSPGVSNAIYGTSMEEDSEFSSDSKATYQNDSQRPMKQEKNKTVNNTNDDTDYENVQKRLGEPNKASGLQNGTETVMVESLSDLANLGVDSINIVSTEAADGTMDSLDYTTVPGKLASPRAHKEHAGVSELCNDKPQTAGASSASSSANMNVYHEVGDIGSPDGYLEPLKTKDPHYEDIF